MVALLKDMRGHMNYNIAHGNTSLFRLNTDNPKVTLLHSLQKLQRGKYIIGISGDYIKSNDSFEQLAEKIYNGVRKLYLKVIVKVV